MANVAAIRIEQSRLTGIEATERRLLAELDQAAEIQRGALPTHPPSSRGLDIAAFNEPSRTVGGDYYDFYQYPDGQLCAVIADVSGKGMPAALLMAMVQSRTQVLLETCQGIAELATRLNASTRNLAGNRFFTFCACVLSPDRDSIEYCNAGHNLPLILRADGKIERLDIGGPPMGILPEYEYTSAAIQFGPGDILIMFSDGLIEETQPRIQEEFGEERLIETFRRARAGSAEEIAAAIRGAVNDWTAGAPIADDQTLIVIRREAS
jgi:sigma-B regulation protein RsbU (phosphoserine phosphatase)